MLGHRWRICLDLGDYDDLVTWQRPRAATEIVRLATGFDTVDASGTMRFVVDAVIPALRASPVKNYSMSMSINDKLKKRRRPHFANLMEAVWDLPISLWTLSLQGYMGPEGLRDMVSLLSAFDLRSRHKERAVLLNPHGDPRYKACWGTCSYHDAVGLLKGGGWQEVILSLR
jgi:hypothetical protein